MRLWVDDREPADFVDTLVSGHGLPAERRRLEIADFWFVPDDAPEDEPVLVVERKAWGDLRASCADGRFRSQRARLRDRFPSSATRVLLVESDAFHSRAKEDWEHPQFGPMNRRCESELLRATVFHDDGMRLVRTYGHEHTCRALAWMYKELADSPRAASKALEASAEDLDAGRRAKRARKEAGGGGHDGDVAKWDRRAALLSLKGLSPPRALAVEAAGRSLAEWGAAFRADAEAAVRALAAAPLPDGKRKLGKALARRLLEMLAY